MIVENILLCILVAYLVGTSGRRNYLGLLVLSYYAAFLCIDIGFFGLDESIYTPFISNNYEYACLALCIVASIIASYLFYKGSNLAGIYSAWLIYNSTICFIGTIYGYGDGVFNFVYNLSQNLNLIIDLFVVVLGTDNILHRTDKLGGYINNTNNRINSLFNNHTNQRIQAQN